MAFAAHEKEFQFDTGLLRGTLRSNGKSCGLTPLVDCGAGATIARGAGLFSHYRILDARNRYGDAAWDWSSRSKLLPCGAVQVLWPADELHPFDMRAVYRWSAANTFDVTTSVVPQKDVRRFEVFRASYFGGFPVSRVWVKPGPENDGKPGFMWALSRTVTGRYGPRSTVLVRSASRTATSRGRGPVLARVARTGPGLQRFTHDCQNSCHGSRVF